MIMCFYVVELYSITLSGKVFWETLVDCLEVCFCMTQNEDCFTV